MVRNKLGAAFLLGVCVSLLWGCSGAADESGGDVVDEINESMVSGINAESEEEVDLEVKKAEQKVREAGQEAKEAEQKVREAGQEAKEAEQEVREAVQELKKVDGNGKSFAELGPIFTELGIGGITEDLIQSLEKYDAGLPDEVIYSRPGTLLASVGHDVYDPDTGESTPQDNGQAERDRQGAEYGKAAVFATDGYQECIVLYAAKEWADLGGERTGFPLFESL